MSKQNRENDDDWGNILRFYGSYCSSVLVIIMAIVYLYLLQQKWEKIRAEPSLSLGDMIFLLVIGGGFILFVGVLIGLAIYRRRKSKVPDMSLELEVDEMVYEDLGETEEGVISELEEEVWAEMQEGGRS